MIETRNTYEFAFAYCYPVAANEDTASEHSNMGVRKEKRYEL